MTIFNKLPLLVVLTTIISSQAFSADMPNSTEFKKHSFGGHLSAGGVEYKGIDNNNDDGVVQLYGYYNYAVSQHFSLELGLNIGTDAENWDCYETDNDNWHCSTNNNNLFGLAVDEIEYSNLVVAVKGKLPLSERNSLYGKVGAQYYDYDINRKNRTLIHDSDIGLYLAAGWQYQWDMGIGMDVGYEAIDMGDLDTYTLNIGMSYQF